MLKGFEARHPVHAIIKEDDVRRLAFDHRDTLFAARSLDYLVVLRRKHAIERVAHLGVVINDEDLRDGCVLGHGQCSQND